jgi:dienelactone hydrolase
MIHSQHQRILCLTLSTFLAAVACAASLVIAQPTPAPAPTPIPAPSAPNHTALEITFPGANNLDLKGELLLPPLPPSNGIPHKLPAVLLLPGSGPTDRNGNQPPLLVTDLLKQIAERLAAEGIASLRFDKRAAPGYRDTWPKDLAAMSDFFSYDNFINDAKGALAYLRGREEIDPKRVAMIGHSEGGLFTLQIARDLDAASAVPAEHPVAKPDPKADPKPATDQPPTDPAKPPAEKQIKPQPLAAIVLMGTAGRTLGPVVHEQIAAALKAQGADEAATKLYMEATDNAIAAITKDAKVPADIPPGLVGLFNASAAKLMQSYFTVDPAELAKQYRGPVLILQGEKDAQVSKDRDTPRLLEALEQRARKPTTPPPSTNPAIAPPVRIDSVELAIIPNASHNLKPVTGPRDPAFTGPVVPEALDKLAAWLKDKLSK